MLDRKKFYRRRQFVLGPRFLDYEGWRQLRPFDEFCLTVHPDLQVTVAEGQGNTAVLLGYAIDPSRTSASDDDILQGLVEKPLTVERVVAALDPLGGRFVLLVKSPEGRWLFHDACGLRQVNYHAGTRGSMWCASQPDLIAEQLGFAYDADALAFRDLPEYRRTTEDFTFIGDRTPFREVKYLLPNHLLDLDSGCTTRFWPAPGWLEPRSPSAAIELMRPILQNGIAAAAVRFRVHFGISAGCDSRKSLAAARAVKDKIVFFTHTPQPGSKADMDIPARLLPTLGIKHHGVVLQKMIGDFEQCYRDSVTWARERHGHISHTALCQFGPDITVLNSNISEYSQVCFWLPKSHLTGEGLALLKRLNHPIAIGDLQRWLDGARTVCEISGMNVLVLFDLEVRSRWVANTLAECDIGYESFNPYNNRRLFEVELSVGERYRRGKRLDFPIRLIKSMWPEVLREPINPESGVLQKVQRLLLDKVIHRTVTPWLPAMQYLKYLKLKSEFKRDSGY